MKKERQFLLISFLSLTFLGLLMVYESSSIYAYRIVSDPMFFFKKQLLYFAVAILAMLAVLLVDLERLRTYNKSILLFNVGLLVLVLLLGTKVGGAKRWLHLGPFNFQPSELLKISFLIYCAEYFRRKRDEIRLFHRGILPLGIILTVICALSLLQPDLGTAMFWVVWTLLMLFLYRARRKHLFLIVITGLILSFFLITFFPYRFKRVKSYIDPFADPQGSGFQLVQSQIAYAEGGFFGVGLGEGKQKLFFLPAAHTDFIYSIIAEEFGMIGSLGLLTLFFILFYRMFLISKRITDPFSQAICWGIVLIFFLEITINIAVTCGLVPTKGLSLPFLSYGGSNLVVHYLLLGLFLNATRACQEDSSEKGILKVKKPLFKRLNFKKI
ncbi:MAG: putative lipid II flippase FtsW [Candidatus Omnitrophica bacterium]|nr:putative lipid II flippase FtsW [Candidatus Omnitrophota bacterium]